MTPVYDGKGQPPNSPGWFSGLTAWWNRLTPTYVTPPTRSATGTAARGYISSTTTTRPPEALSGASDKATVSPSAPPDVASAAQRGYISSTTTTRLPEAPSSASDKATVSPSAPPTATSTAAKP